MATPRGTSPQAGSVCLGAARSAVCTPDYKDLDRGPYLPRMGAPTLSQPFSPCKVLGSAPRESAQYVRYRPLLSEGAGQGLPGGPDAALAEGETWRAGQAGAAVGLPAVAGASGGAGPRPEKRRQKVSGRLWPAVWLRAVSAGFSWVPGRELTSPSPPLTCKARCWLDTPTGWLRKSWPPSLSLGPRRGVRFDRSRGRGRKHLPIPGT